MLRLTQFALNDFEMATGKFVKFHLRFPDSRVLESINGCLTGLIFMNGFANVRSFVGASKQISSTLKEPRQRQFHEIDKGLQVFSEADKKVFVSKVEFGLL